MANRSGIRYERAYQQREFYFSAVSGTTFEDVPCAYCGDRAIGDDHIYPWNSLRRMGPGWLTWVVPACQWCNSTASDQVFTSPRAKRSYLRERMRGKLAGLGQADWSDEEIEELGPTLRSHVRRAVAERKILESRISYKGMLPRSMFARRGEEWAS